MDWIKVKNGLVAFFRAASETKISMKDMVTGNMNGIHRDAPPAPPATDAKKTAPPKNPQP